MVLAQIFPPRSGRKETPPWQCSAREESPLPTAVSLRSLCPRALVLQLPPLPDARMARLL